MSARLWAVSTLAVGLLLTSAANAVVIFDNFTSAEFENEAAFFGYTAIFRSDANQTISQIDAQLRINQNANVAFHIYSLGAESGPPIADRLPVFSTTRYFAADSSMVYRESKPLSFDFVAGQWYAVGVVADASITWSHDTAESVNPGPTFTSLPMQNYNILGFTVPTMRGDATGCCNHHYRLHSPDASVPEPATLALLGLGLAGLAASRRRKQ